MNGQIVRLDIITAAAIMAVAIVVAASSITVHNALAQIPSQTARDFAPGRVAIGDPNQRASDIAPGHIDDPTQNNPGHLKNLPR